MPFFEQQPRAELADCLDVLARVVVVTR